MTIKYPKNQYVEMNYKNEFLVTREMYGHGSFTLYAIDKNGSVKKLKTSMSPVQFTEVYPIGGGDE
ncbi:MAG: hypothetical protein RSD74_01710 [Angelakisella sp.]